MEGEKDYVRGMKACFARMQEGKLIGASSLDDFKDGEEEYLDIEQHGIVCNVVYVELGVQMHGQFASSVHLPPSRNTGRDLNSLPLPGLVLFGDERLFRSGADH